MVIMSWVFLILHFQYITSHLNVQHNLFVCYDNIKPIILIIFKQQCIQLLVQVSTIVCQHVTNILLASIILGVVQLLSFGPIYLQYCFRKLVDQNCLKIKYYSLTYKTGQNISYLHTGCDQKVPGLSALPCDTQTIKQLLSQILANLTV